eukprot:gene21410-3574_t
MKIPTHELSSGALEALLPASTATGVSVDVEYVCVVEVVVRVVVDLVAVVDVSVVDDSVVVVFVVVRVIVVTVVLVVSVDVVFVSVVVVRVVLVTVVVDNVVVRDVPVAVVDVAVLVVEVLVVYVFVVDVLVVAVLVVVDEKTGDMAGSWVFLPEEMNPSTFVMQLVATDARGETAVVEIFTMNVRNPVFTPYKIPDPDTGVTIRKGADEDSIDPNTLDSDYFFFSVPELHSYKIFGPVLDPRPQFTILTAGTFEDIRFSLTGDSDGWAVDDLTGDMAGAWPYLDEERNPSTYVMKLVATDARGDTAVVEVFTFNVRNPEFLPKLVETDSGLPVRTGSDGATDPRSKSSEDWYLTGQPYKFYPPVINGSLTTVTLGTPDEVTYKLTGQSDGWSVDYGSGVMVGEWPHLDELETPAEYVMQLVAMDARGREAVIEEFTMITTRTSTATTTTGTSTTNTRTTITRTSVTYTRTTKTTTTPTSTTTQSTTTKT